MIPRWPAALWTLGVWVALWMPPTGPSSIPHADKVVHVALFLGLSLLWGWSGLSSVRVACLGLAIGFVTELGQPWLPWPRHFDGWDLLADAIGTAAGTLAGAMLVARMRARSRLASREMRATASVPER